MLRLQSSSSLAVTVVLAAAVIACGRSERATPQAKAEFSPQAKAEAPSEAPSKVELPAAYTLEFTDPEPGPRAPTTAAFRAQIGRSDLASVEAMTGGLGLSCGDTSVRAMMEHTRQQKVEEAKAAGKSVDAISSASWMKKSPREELPQVRYSCGKVDSSVVYEDERAPSRGRLLYVFDSAELPLRHASYQRTHKDQAAALRDLSEARDRAQAIYGEPTSTRGELPIAAEDGSVEFPALKNIEYEWRFADLLVKVSALKVNATDVTVGERFEVPVGIRPDAPSFLDQQQGDAPEPSVTAETQG